MNGDKYISILIVIDYIITTSAFTETDSEIFVSVFVIIHSANLNLISISTNNYFLNHYYSCRDFYECSRIPRFLFLAWVANKDNICQLVMFSIYSSIAPELWASSFIVIVI